MERRGREEKTVAHRVKISGGPERKDTRERHAWRSRTTCNHYHKYIKSDLTYVLSARPGSRRDRSISTPSRWKTNDRWFSLRALWIACCTDRIRHMSRSREIPESDTHAYWGLKCTSPFTAICKRQQICRDVWRRSFQNIAIFHTDIYIYNIFFVAYIIVYKCGLNVARNCA